MALTIKEVKTRLPAHVKIVDSTYVNMLTACRFIDADYGEFTAKPKKVIQGQNHKLRTKQIRHDRLVMPIEEIKVKLKEVHPNVTIDESTYVDASTKAKFTDGDGKEWWQAPKIVLRGHGHTSKKVSKKIKGIESLQVQLEKIRQTGVAIELAVPSYCGMRKHADFIIDGEPKTLVPSYVVYKYLTQFGLNTEAPASSSWAGKRVSVAEVKRRLPLEVTLVEDTYVKASEECTFIDSDFGEFKMSPSRVFLGEKHPLRRKYADKSLPLEEFQKRLPPHIKIKEGTYKSLADKATFIDTDYGEWETLAGIVNKGCQHPSRAADGMSIPIEEVKERLPDYITVVEDTYTNTFTKATFIDKEYGAWDVIPQAIFQGHRHPGRANSYTKPEMLMEEVLGVKKYDLYPHPSIRYRPDFKLNEGVYVNVDGLYWHSDARVKDTYHYKMREAYEPLGWHILQFYENEVFNKPHVVFSAVDACLDRNISIGTEKLKISGLSKTVARDFIAFNSLEPFCEKSKYLALINKNGKQMLVVGYREYPNECVLTNICSLSGVEVKGGLALILEELKSLGVTRFKHTINLRYQTASALVVLGFEETNTETGFVWTDRKRTYPTETEPQEGWNKIYHAGMRTLEMKVAEKDVKLVWPHKEWFAAYKRLGGISDQMTFLAQQQIFENLTIDAYIKNGTDGARKLAWSKWVAHIKDPKEANRYFEAVDSVTAYS